MKPRPLRPSSPPFAAALRPWLRVGGSLTAHLGAAYGPVTVRCRHQGHGWAAAAEAVDLGLHRPASRAVHVREVLLFAGDQARVFARTVLSPGASRTVWRAIRGLGSRPLADLLFQQPHRVRRSALSAVYHGPAEPFTRHVAREWRAASGTALPGRGLWARASVFERRGYRLRVMECFPARSSVGQVGRRFR
ncbi:chorismate lyase [Leptothrix ochracea]|uniref:chorismate--pyruvate lyase family protein n=1 Tax=Leptothrix ochracea TaxID=735331 RepID=UPI0034E2A3C3